MTTIEGAINPVRVVSVAQQGPAGPPGPGFTSRMANFYALEPVAATIPVISASAYAITIGGVNNLRVSAGSLTLSIRINGVDVTGLSGIVVTTTPQNLTASGANSVAVGDRVTVVIIDPVGAANLEFTMN